MFVHRYECTPAPYASLRLFIFTCLQRMPPKFQKSRNYAKLDQQHEDDVLDAYSWILETTGTQDVVLAHIPLLLDHLAIPHIYTRDIAECIEWFYDIAKVKAARGGPRWIIAQDLLTQLTISSYVNGEFDVSDVVDIDKLLKFCARLIKFRDCSETIESAWALFLDAGGSPKTGRLSAKELRRVKSYLQLDDISDSILIDMLGCGAADGRVDFSFSGLELSIGIKSFAEILGQLGELD